MSTTHTNKVSYGPIMMAMLHCYLVMAPYVARVYVDRSAAVRLRAGVTTICRGALSRACAKVDRPGTPESHTYGSPPWQNPEIGHRDIWRFGSWLTRFGSWCSVLLNEVTDDEFQAHTRAL